MNRLLLLACILLFPALAFGADGPHTEPTLWEQLLPGAITLIVPLLISGSRLLIPLLPKWLLPILAPVLGAVMSLVLDASSGAEVGLIMGAVYGGLGTWLREFIKQMQQANQQPVNG